MRNLQDWLKVFESINAGHNPDSVQALNQSFDESKDFIENDIIHPHDKVLDIGCGNGRQAVALEQYNIDKYVGIDPIKESVDFCKNAFKGLEKFDFIHIDLHNETYNPNGSIDPLEMQIPYRDGYFDTVIAVSLFTHLGTIEACKHYVEEINRALKSRGNFFSSWFCSPPNQLSSDHDRTVLDKSKILQIFSKYFKIYHMRGGTTTDCNDQWCIYAQKINSLNSDSYRIMPYIEESSTGRGVEDFVTQFYQQCLGSEPDAPGLEGWVNALRNGSISGADVAHRFILSPEFIDRNTINEDFVTILYRAFFGREPDPGGYDGWMNYINSGASRQEVLSGFIYSPEFENLCNSYDIAPFLRIIMNPVSLDRKKMTVLLAGQGVEIGAGNLPMVFENEVDITYLDKNSQEELQKLFPEVDYPQLGKVVIGDSDESLNLEPNSYNFLVSAHVIEHLKNPFKSLEHWCKVVKEGGYIYIIFPNRDDCFDKGRPYTTVSHLAQEYELDNNSVQMKQNLFNHLREHYGNTDFRGKEHLMDNEIDYEYQINIGVAHYHVFGVNNSCEFFEYSREHLKFPLKIVERQYAMGEIRYLLQKITL